jgi:hypothetical protein
MPLQLDADARGSLERQIMDLDGVRFAALDLQAGRLWVIRDAHHDAGPIELAVRSHLISLGSDAEQVQISVALPADVEPRRRVRFLHAERSDTHLGVTITVSMEWNGQVHNGSATGERGAAVELKTAGQAALNALEELSRQPLETRIIGVKVVHAFDSNVMVASMIRDGAPPHRLVGAIIVGSDPIHSAALAVLSGLNRTLGNFLHTTD